MLYVLDKEQLNETIKKKVCLQRTLKYCVLCTHPRHQGKSVFTTEAKLYVRYLKLAKWFQSKLLHETL